MSKSNTASNLVFFLVGAAVGAGVALLYAPQDGATTRKKIGEKATEVKEKATEITSGAAATARTKVAAAGDKLQDLIERGNGLESLIPH